MVLAHDFAHGYVTTLVADLVIFAHASQTHWNRLEYAFYRDIISRVYDPMSRKAVPSTIHGKHDLCTVETRYMHVCAHLHLVSLWCLRLTTGERTMLPLADSTYLHDRMAISTPPGTYTNAMGQRTSVHALKMGFSVAERPPQP
jgi:hypothetical protein